MTPYCLMGDGLIERMDQLFLNLLHKFLNNEAEWTQDIHYCCTFISLLRI